MAIRRNKQQTPRLRKKRTIKLSKGPSLEEQEEFWDTQYREYVKRTGKYICGLSWEGYKKHGRGAIFASYDNAKAKADQEKGSGVLTSAFVPAAEFEKREEAGMGVQDGSITEILQRIAKYDPEQDFVVVFEAGGLMGTDIVHPSISPPEMARLYAEGEIDNIDDDDSDDEGVEVSDLIYEGPESVEPRQDDDDDDDSSEEDEDEQAVIMEMIRNFQEEQAAGREARRQPPPRREGGQDGGVVIDVDPIQEK